MGWTWRCSKWVAVRFLMRLCWNNNPQLMEIPQPGHCGPRPCGSLLDSLSWLNRDGSLTFELPYPGVRDPCVDLRGMRRVIPELVTGLWQCRLVTVSLIAVLSWSSESGAFLWKSHWLLPPGDGRAGWPNELGACPTLLPRLNSSDPFFPFGTCILKPPISAPPGIKPQGEELCHLVLLGLTMKWLWSDVM